MNTLQLIGRKGDCARTFAWRLLSLQRLSGLLRPGASRQGRQQRAARTRAKRSSTISTRWAITRRSCRRRCTFLLDATLGMINIEQSNIIKIFSIAAGVFLPPTLIASIYGMNFSFMPELRWTYGYAFAGVLMLASALLPFWYFKRRGWL